MAPKFVKLIVKQELKLASPLFGSFVADLGSDIVSLSSNATLLRGLSPEEVSLSRRLIETLFRAAGSERKILDATESHFRRTVLAKLDVLAAQPIPRRVKDRLMMEMVLSISHHRSSLSGALLRADIDRPVPFHGRERDVRSAARIALSHRRRPTSARTQKRGARRFRAALSRGIAEARGAVDTFWEEQA